MSVCGKIHPYPALHTLTCQYYLTFTQANFSFIRLQPLEEVQINFAPLVKVVTQGITLWKTMSLFNPFDIFSEMFWGIFYCIRFGGIPKVFYLRFSVLASASAPGLGRLLSAFRLPTFFDPCMPITAFRGASS